MLIMASTRANDDLSVTRDHRRQWRGFTYVYPVVSRRASGVSVGVNLNLDKRCNFRCVYCQVDRRPRPARAARRRGRHVPIDLPLLASELRDALGQVISGRLWREKRFAATPPEMRRLNDIAFSGNGEPTCLPDFDKAVAVAAGVKARLGLGDVKLVVITNAALLDQPQFLRAIPILQQSNGQVWAKLDAGTEKRFRRVNRPRGRATLDDICRNIAAAARQVPVAIQMLLFAMNGRPPASAELAAYCRRISGMLRAGAQITQVQLHTIARPPAERNVRWLTDDQMDAMADTVRTALPGLDVTVTYGADMPPQ